MLSSQRLRVVLTGFSPEMMDSDDIRSAVSRAIESKHWAEAGTLCEDALSRVSCDESPQLWAWLQTTLADCLTQNPFASQDENLERAIAVYEVASFYSMYEHKPVGRHKICLCTNVSCMINGSDNILEHLSNRLGIGFGQVTGDGKFSLKEVECLGACGGAPMMQIGHTYYENLTPELVDRAWENMFVKEEAIEH